MRKTVAATAKNLGKSSGTVRILLYYLVGPRCHPQRQRVCLGTRDRRNMCIHQSPSQAAHEKGPFLKCLSSIFWFVHFSIFREVALLKVETSSTTTTTTAATTSIITDDEPLDARSFHSDDELYCTEWQSVLLDANELSPFWNWRERVLSPNSFGVPIVSASYCLTFRSCHFLWGFWLPPWHFMRFHVWSWGSVQWMVV